ncbi:hypothetical protein X474_16700 [Dethiosulfatarculus sandiegensis]|uniref:Uncharacterized protein n=1 Tax=Dethiosulfatarculus sandiegensis TaxID=1429043 RepID=A0A0D2J475_9BACT|nr:hypothetical protein X474_16700 [Dethiosulfatarculus sandiegensis]
MFCSNCTAFKFLGKEKNLSGCTEKARLTWRL